MKYFSICSVLALQLSTSFPAMAACEDWGRAQQDILWAIELDAGAKKCVSDQMKLHGKGSIVAVLKCNDGANSKNIKSCKKEACKFLTERRWVPC